MGKTDTVTRQYVKDNQVFADAFNYLIYGGQEIIQPRSLHRMDSVATEVPYGSDGAQLPVQKIRDGLKYLTAMTDEHTAYVILGNAEFKIDSKSEVVDVCKAIAEIRDEGHTEGFVEGHAEGRAEGALEANKETALRMLKEGSFSYGMISAMTSLPLEEVERLAGNSTDFSGDHAVQ